MSGRPRESEESRRACRARAAGRGVSALLASLAVAAVALIGRPATGQEPAADARRQAAPAARGQEARGEAAEETSLEDFAWLAGTWRGPGPQGTTAEIHFMAPRAGGMPSLFRLWQGDRIVTIEAISLVETPEGLFMYVRHFSPELIPMEKEAAIRLRLAERRGDAFRFDNVRVNRNPRTSVLTRTERGFASRSVLVGPDGSTREIRVEYERAGK